MKTILFDIGFLNVAFVDLLDILMVALIIYFLFRWLRNSSALNIVIAIVAIMLLRVVVNALNMKMMSALLGTVLNVGAIAVIIIFQPEIRQFLNNLGRRSLSSTRKMTVRDWVFGRKGMKMEAGAADKLVRACFEMSEGKVGALIVLPNKDPIEKVISSGDMIDAEINRNLIENIFFKNSPLHDGAMVINNGRIVAARCTLPLTDRTDIPDRYGMRHKAAIGISEISDASVIVVSEETGGVSFVTNGRITAVDNPNTLKLLLENDGQTIGSKAGV